MSSFYLVSFTEDHGKEICTWKYEAPYDLFGWNISWDKLVIEGIEFGDPLIREKQYMAVMRGKEELCGFAQFFPLIGVTRLGLGMRPDLCGQGLGLEFVRAIVKQAQLRMPGNEIDLEVLTWNERARKVYEKAGFLLTDTYCRPTPTGYGEFHCMVYQKGE